MTNIIVADDDPEIRRLLKFLLKLEGYNVMVARDGNEVLEHARFRKIDALITDIIMPGKEGIETIMEIRELYPDIKIVAMSGGGKKGNEDFLKSAEMVGAHCTIAKPFEPDDFIKTLKNALKARF